MVSVDLGMPGFRVGSFNCNGLGNVNKRDLVLNWLKSKPEEVILLQETHTTPSTEHAWRRAWDGDIIFNHGSSNSTGVTILFKRNSNIKIGNYRTIIQGRATLVEIEVDSVKFCLVNVYCPNNNETSVVETVFLETLGRTRDDYPIFVGDWNTVLNNTVDKWGGNPTHSNSKRQTYINNIMADYGLCDIFRLSRSNDRVYTHFNKQHKTRTRLDFFIIDDNLVNFPVCETDISHGFNSDHSYISLNLQGSPVSHGRGYWKLNNSHLLNEDFVSSVRDIIHETTSSSFDSHGGLWDVIKMKIKDFAIRYGKNRKKVKNDEKRSCKKK